MASPYLKSVKDAEASLPLPSPKPTQLRHSPSAAEFQQWCENPVTMWVAKAYGAGAEMNKAAWARLLNGSAEMTPDDLHRARVAYSVRADAYAAFLETTHSDYLKLNDPEEWSNVYGKA
jgi:hypothetical protein